MAEPQIHIADACPTGLRLADFLAGDLPEADFDLVSTHVASCPQCSAAIAALPSSTDHLIVSLRNLSGRSTDADEAAVQQEAARLAADPFATKQPTVVSPPKAVPDLLRLREYRVESLLGHGGMGRVYRAVHEQLGKVVALKLMAARTDAGAESATRFQREMRAVGRLDHPNIVRATDAGEAEGVPFLIMEYVPGTDLARFLERAGPLPIAAACEVARQAALGLGHAHDHGLVHRDVKPSNLMLTPDGMVKLLDLGLARWRDATGDAEATASGTLMGTFNYMAPEQADDPRQVDHRADIYSLGCTLYHLLTGEAPFPAPEFETPYQKMRAHATAPRPSVQALRPETPDGLAVVLDQMLAKDPAGRFATASEAADALTPCAAGADLPALYSTHSPPAEADAPSFSASAAAVVARRRRRRWWPWAAALSLMATGIWLTVARHWPIQRTIPEHAPILEPLVVVSISGESSDEGLTLRDAITRANTAANDVRIDITATGVIELKAPLPPITGRLELNGTASHLVTISRAASAPSFRVLTVAPSAHVTIRGVTLSGGSAPEGGGVLNRGQLTLSHCVVRDNVAATRGGGIANDGTLELDTTAIVENHAGEWGGGIFSAGRLLIFSSAICDNIAASHGGGVYSQNALSATASTIARNQTDKFGGGLVADGGTCLLTSVTVTANRADRDGDGNGDGGGLRVFNISAARLYNTIVAGNLTGAGAGRPNDITVLGGDVTGGHNLIGAAPLDCALRDVDNGNQVGTTNRPLDPKLAPLADGTGRLTSYLPRPGSPAIDLGDNAKAGGADQRGLRRIVNGTIDIGAIEVQPGERP